MANTQALAFTFPKRGIDNVNPVPAKGYVHEALNVDIHNGVVFSRDVPVPVVHGTNHRIHSLWATPDVLYAGADNLLVMVIGSHLEPLFAFAQERPLHYLLYNDRVYVSNGDELVYVQAGVAVQATIPQPAEPIVALYPYGDLPAGDYLVAVTYKNTLTGEESASSSPIRVTLGQQGGLSVTVQTTPQGYTPQVYLSLTDETALYNTGVIVDSGIPVLLATRPRGELLRTAYMRPIPAGSCITWAGGRLLVAKNDCLYFSEPLFPHVMHAEFNYLLFNNIHFVERLDTNDVYVGDDDGVWFITDMANPSRATARLVSTLPPLSNAVQVDIERADKQTNELAPTTRMIAWLSAQGFVYGQPGGILTFTTAQTYNPSGILNGTARTACIQQRGCPQIISLVNQQVL